jgi:hypothetical protein
MRGIPAPDDGLYDVITFPSSWQLTLSGSKRKAAVMNLLVSILIRTIEVMFVAGVIGSAIVVLLTSVEDFKMLFEKESSSGRN